MRPPDDQGRVTVDQAVERFRTRVVAELRALNQHLPCSRRLERGEIDRLVDKLLYAVREMPRRRDASMLDKAVWMASGVLVQAIRRRGRRRKAAGAVPHWNRLALDEGAQPRGESGAPAVPLARGLVEKADTAASGAADENRVA